MRIFFLILLTLILSYGIIAFWTGDWNAIQWDTDKSEAWKLIGGAVLLFLFVLFRNRLNWPK
jgi:hypothetical protein